MDVVIGVDRYATRTPAPTAAVERTDPVVWNAQTPAHLQGFEANGVTQRERVIGEDLIEGCLREVHRLGEDPGLAGDRRIVREKGSSAVRSIFEITELSAVVADAVEVSGAEVLARETLGSEVYVHQSRLNYKPGFRGGASSTGTPISRPGMPRTGCPRRGRSAPRSR